MSNIDPFSPEREQPSALSGIRVSKEAVVLDEFTQALVSGETKIREARERVLAALGDSSCRGCYLFNNKKDPLAWARNGQNISASSIESYATKYVSRLQAAEDGKCGGIVDKTAELLEEMGISASELSPEMLDRIAPLRCGQDEGIPQQPILH